MKDSWHKVSFSDMEGNAEFQRVRDDHLLLRKESGESLFDFTRSGFSFQTNKKNLPLTYTKFKYGFRGKSDTGNLSRIMNYIAENSVFNLLEIEQIFEHQAQAVLTFPYNVMLFNINSDADNPHIFPLAPKDQYPGTEIVHYFKEGDQIFGEAIVRNRKLNPHPSDFPCSTIVEGRLKYKVHLTQNGFQLMDSLQTDSLGFKNLLTSPPPQQSVYTRDQFSDDYFTTVYKKLSRKEKDHLLNDQLSGNVQFETVCQYLSQVFITELMLSADHQVKKAGVMAFQQKLESAYENQFSHLLANYPPKLVMNLRTAFRITYAQTLPAALVTNGIEIETLENLYEAINFYLNSELHSVYQDRLRTQFDVHYIDTTGKSNESFSRNWEAIKAHLRSNNTAAIALMYYKTLYPQLSIDEKTTLNEGVHRWLSKRRICRDDANNLFTIATKNNPIQPPIWQQFISKHASLQRSYKIMACIAIATGLTAIGFGLFFPPLAAIGTGLIYGGTALAGITLFGHGIQLYNKPIDYVRHMPQRYLIYAPQENAEPQPNILPMPSNLEIPPIHLHEEIPASRIQEQLDQVPETAKPRQRTKSYSGPIPITQNRNDRAPPRCSSL